jgi:glycosyltransferase involved in cell wall biosynthesis
MNPDPLVSVIIPCYNSEKFLGEAVSSVLDQLYKNFELIIVDDSSTDTSFRIATQISEKDKRVRAFRIAHSGLPAAARNAGIAEANGELIAFLDSDDKWTKEKLMQQVNYFIEKPDAVFVYSMSITFGDVNIFSPMYELLPLFFRAAKNRNDLLKQGNSIPLSSVVVRTDKLKEAGGFDEDPLLKAVEDYDLWLRLSSEGNFYFLPRIHVYYRIHGNQSSSGWSVKEERLKNLMAKRNLKLPEYKYLRKKGGLYLLFRNAVHYKAYLLARILALPDKFR